MHHWKFTNNQDGLVTLKKIYYTLICADDYRLERDRLQVM